MFKNHVVDCQQLLAFIRDTVPHHMSSGRLTSGLVNRVSKRLLIEAIFRSLPSESICNRIKLTDYKLLTNVSPEGLEYLLDVVMDDIKALLYNKNIGVDNYTYLSCYFDGAFLYIKAGMEKCTINSTTSVCTESYES